MMREEVSYSSRWDRAGLPFSLPEEYDRLALLVTVIVNGRGFIDYQEVQQTCNHPTFFFSCCMKKRNVDRGQEIF